MLLRSSPASPFGRKVKIAANILGLDKKITVVLTDTLDPADPVRSDNPLGKIPVLVLEDGSSLYDSRVIVEYLDHISGGNRIIPTDSKARFDALRLQALCDGIAEAALLIVYESRYRSEDKRVETWVDHQQGKIDRGLASLEVTIPALISALPTIGQITAACMLGYLDLRFAGKWRENHPALVAWLAIFVAKFPVYEKTKMPPA